MNRDRRDAIEALLAEYGGRLDAEDYQSWLDLFAETCSYRIVPRENVEQGLPAALVLCENKKALTDRVVALLKANQYSPFQSRHLIGGVRLRDETDGICAAEASYALYHTDKGGRSRLFGVGLYDDRIVFVDGAPRFRSKTVIVDTYDIPDFLVKPI